MAKQRKVRKLCWNYAKGACSYGAKCKFLHAQEEGTDDASPTGSAVAPSAEDAEMQRLTAQFVELVEKVRHGQLTAEMARLKQTEGALAVERDDLLSKLESFSAKNVELKEELRTQVAKTAELEQALAEASVASLGMVALEGLNAGLELELKKASVEKAELEEQLKAEVGRTAELDKRLANASSEQGCASPKSGAEWQFSTGPHDWSSFPADRSEELQRRFEEYVKKGGAALVRMRSGVEEYEVDLKDMEQNNVKTQKTRKIRCTFNTPAHWTRSTNLAAIYNTEPAESIELSGFKTCIEVNDVYTKCAGMVVNGHPVWWNAACDVMMYKAWVHNNLNIVPLTKDYPGVFEGRNIAMASLEGGGPNPWNKGKWREYDGKQFSEATIVTRSPTSPSAVSLVNIAVVVSDASMTSKLSALLSDSVSHQSVHSGASVCDSFKKGVKIIRVLRIENWHLWMKYRSHAEQMTRDLLKYRVQVEPIEPRLPVALENFSKDYGGGLDATLNEQFLFHGTS